jgi:protein-L-isoaspartate(D-aspartate) O-methyltransferase
LITPSQEVATTAHPETDAAELSALRSAYAAGICATAQVADARLRDAFASVPRERHLFPPPWRISGRHGIQDTSDVRDLYADVLVGLVEEEGINNGEPSLHALAIAQAAPAPGEHVVHVGAGGGYYTAVLAELVGLDGDVTAFEIEPSLAALARGALADRANVAVEERSGTGPLPAADIVYVSAGTPTPAESWLEALVDGGRLVFPMTPSRGTGAMLRVHRLADRFTATFFCRCRFIPLIGGGQPSASDALERAFTRGGAGEVRSLRRGALPVDRRDVWFAWDGGYLSREPVDR